MDGKDSEPKEEVGDGLKWGTGSTGTGTRIGPHKPCWDWMETEIGRHTGTRPESGRDPESKG